MATRTPTGVTLAPELRFHNMGTWPRLLGNAVPVQKRADVGGVETCFLGESNASLNLI